MLARLLRRPEFLAVAATQRKWVTPTMIVQVRRSEEGGPVRFGLTASRKVGGAVQRNRARRRLRALAEQVLPNVKTPCHLVLIARTACVTSPYLQLKADLQTALGKLLA